MIENYIFDRVCDYVDSEISYIKQDMEVSGFSKELAKDLVMLDNLDCEDKTEITKLVVNDDEFDDKIRELIHYYLYHK